MALASIPLRAASDFLRPGGPYLFVRAITASYALSAVGRLIPVRPRQVAGYRPRPLRATAIGACWTAAICGVVACALALTPPASRPAPSVLVTRVQAARPALAVGVFEPGEWSGWQPVQRFAASVGRDPGIALMYASWPGGFDTRFAAMADAHHALPFIQVLPAGGVTMGQVADGSLDAQLESYARQVRDFRHRVLLSFAPEANGQWYRWGWGSTPASTWVAAWRHVVTTFRSQGARDVTWVMTLNVTFPDSGPVADYWPGDTYVDEVGIDGYFVRPSDTFSGVFGPVLSAVRRVTARPVIISETAVGPREGAAAIDSLFAGARASHIGALVWFDQAQHDGLYHQDWRLEDNPAALAAFRAEARK